MKICIIDNSNQALAVSSVLDIVHEKPIKTIGWQVTKPFQAVQNLTFLLGNNNSMYWIFPLICETLQAFHIDKLYYTRKR